MPFLNVKYKTSGETNSINIVFVPFWKGVHSIKKEFAPRGSKFFPYRVDPFPKEFGVQWSKQEVTKVVSPGRKGVKSTKCIQFP